MYYIKNELKDYLRNRKIKTDNKGFIHLEAIVIISINFLIDCVCDFFILKFGLEDLNSTTYVGVKYEIIVKLYLQSYNCMILIEEK